MAPPLDPVRRRRRLLRRAGWLAAGVALIGGGVWGATRLFGQEEAAPYRTAAVERGDLSRTVSASGELEALVTVDVGSQLSGQVTQVLVDFNDQVRRGQTLAVLDASTYDSRVEQAEAGVAASAANVNSQQAGLAQAQASVGLAQAEYGRQKFLFDRGIAAQAALDTAAAELARARAGVQTSQAQIRAASAQVNQQRAALRSNLVERARTTVVAPIDGVIVDRQIEPGQTVAASLSAPVLFVIAQDLSRVQANILVDEADIGQVREGQPVRFTVDAFPEETFRGTVTQVRKQPQKEQNVVAYVVLAEADNPRGRLLPGMTANADIIIEEKRGVLKVPAAALRFTPVDADAPRPGAGGLPGLGGGASPNRQAGGQGGRGQGGGQGGARMLEQLDLTAEQARKAQPILQAAQAGARGGGGGGDPAARRTARREAMNRAFDQIEPILTPAQRLKLEALRARVAGGGQRGTVWIVGPDGKPQAVRVRVGASDGSFTEVTGPIRAGAQVIIGGGPRAPADLRGPGGGGRGGGGGAVRVPL